MAKLRPTEKSMLVERFANRFSEKLQRNALEHLEKMTQETQLEVGTPRNNYFSHTAYYY
jgi:hypothetical protein